MPVKEFAVLMRVKLWYPVSIMNDRMVGYNGLTGDDWNTVGNLIISINIDWVSQLKVTVGTINILYINYGGLWITSSRQTVRFEKLEVTLGYINIPNTLININMTNIFSSISGWTGIHNRLHTPHLTILFNLYTIEALDKFSLQGIYCLIKLLLGNA